jgi:hypothetical protein
MGDAYRAVMSRPRSQPEPGTECERGSHRRRRGTDTPPKQSSVSRRAEETAAALRAAGSMLRRCAWCGAVKFEGRAWGREDESVVRYLDRQDLVTHGICPTCFDAEMERLSRASKL